MISEEKFPCELFAGLLCPSFVVLAVCLRQLSANQIRHPKLFFHPQGHRLEERPKSGGRIVEISFQQPVELQQRFVIKADKVQLLGSDAGFLQAIARGIDREIVIVLDAGEAFFLRGGDNLAIDDETGR